MISRSIASFDSYVYNKPVYRNNVAMANLRIIAGGASCCVATPRNRSFYYILTGNGVYFATRAFWPASASMFGTSIFLYIDLLNASARRQHSATAWARRRNRARAVWSMCGATATVILSAWLSVVMLRGKSSATMSRQLRPSGGLRVSRSRCGCTALSTVMASRPAAFFYRHASGACIWQATPWRNEYRASLRTLVFLARRKPIVIACRPRDLGAPERFPARNARGDACYITKGEIWR